jgi:dUTPase
MASTSSSNGSTPATGATRGLLHNLADFVADMTEKVLHPPSPKKETVREAIMKDFYEDLKTSEKPSWKELSELNEHPNYRLLAHCLTEDRPEKYLANLRLYIEGSQLPDPRDHICNPVKSGGVLFWKKANFVDLLGTLLEKVSCDDYPEFHIAAMKFLAEDQVDECEFTLDSNEDVAPSRERYSDAGFDLHVSKLREVKILPGALDPRNPNRLLSMTEPVPEYETRTGLPYPALFMYGTGVRLSPQAGVWFQLVGRSSLAKTGYVVANGVGIIDSGYRGEVIVGLRRTVACAPQLELPCRVVQLIPQGTRHLLGMKQVKSLDTTSREDNGGLGSRQFNKQ